MLKAARTTLLQCRPVLWQPLDHSGPNRLHDVTGERAAGVRTDLEHSPAQAATDEDGSAFQAGGNQ